MMGLFLGGRYFVAVVQPITLNVLYVQALLLMDLAY